MPNRYTCPNPGACDCGRGGQSCSHRPAAPAPSAELYDDLREIVWHASNLIAQGESPTQRRQPSAQAIYRIAHALLARQEARNG